MKRILITGATGFVGTSVVEAFLASDEEVKIFCLYKGLPSTLADERLVWIECDLEDVSTHWQLMDEIKPTHCIHLAWHVPPQGFWHSSKNVDWLYISVKLFEAFGAAGGRCFLGAGSIGEYDMSYHELSESSTPLIPQSLYGETKRSLFLLLQQIKKRNFPEIILLWARIGYFFGESQPSEKLFTKLLRSLELGIRLEVMPASTKRPYAHVKYLGQAFVKALFMMKEDTVFNVASSKAQSLKQIVGILAESIERDSSPILYGRYKPPVREPNKSKIATDVFKKATRWAIPDTFAQDLAAFGKAMREKHFRK